MSFITKIPKNLYAKFFVQKFYLIKNITATQRIAET